jgi:hypothetical protein
MVPIAIAAIINAPPPMSHRMGPLEKNALTSKEPVLSAVIAIAATSQVPASHADEKIDTSAVWK